VTRLDLVDAQAVKLQLARGCLARPAYPTCVARLRGFTPNLRAPGAQIAPKFRSKMIIKPPKIA